MKRKRNAQCVDLFLRKYFCFIRQVKPYVKNGVYHKMSKFIEILMIKNASIQIKQLHEVDKVLFQTQKKGKKTT